MSLTITEVSTDDIEPGPNPRQTLIDGELQEMALSIAALGVLVPLWLEPGLRRRFQTVDGAKRLAASKIAGLSTVPAYVQPKPLSETQRAEKQLVANSQRSDINPIEKAQAIHGIMEATRQTAGEVAARIGKSQSMVSKHLSLLRLTSDVQALVASGQLSLTHGNAISSEVEPDRQRALAAEAIKEQLTRDQLGRRVRRTSATTSKPAKNTVSRITLQLPGTQRLTFFGKTDSLDSFAEILAAVVAKARKSARGGCDLPGFVALVNAETRAHA